MEKITLTEDHELSAYYRGVIIQYAIEVEVRMDQVITIFLSPNNLEKAFDIIEILDTVESIGFHGKNRIIQYIMKKRFPEFLKNKKDFLNDIDNIIRKRNYVAHKRQSIDGGDYSKLSWAKTSKNSVTTKTYSLDKESIEEYKSLAIKVICILEEFYFLIGKG